MKLRSKSNEKERGKDKEKDKNKNKDKEKEEEKEKKKEREKEKDKELEREKEREKEKEIEKEEEKEKEKEKEVPEFESRVLRSSRRHKQSEKVVETKEEKKEIKKDIKEEVKTHAQEKKKSYEEPPVTRSKKSSLRDTELSGSSFSSNSTSVNLKRKRNDNESSSSHPNKKGHSNEVSTQSKIEHDKLKGWRKNILMIWNDIANHRYGPVFLNPVKVEDAPDYYDIIKKPMDLNSIKQRVKDGVIKSTIEFHRDVMLMCTNSLMYNQEDSEVYPMALEMKEHADKEIKYLRIYENRRQQRNTVVSKQPSAGTVRRRISVNNTHDDK
ncbi:Bromodomain-containing protein [Neocallimastix sp. 'constans']|jgi:chemotaxis protein histidine kinase CheA